MCISFSLLTTICTGCGLSTLNKDYDDNDGDNKDYGWMDGWMEDKQCKNNPHRGSDRVRSWPTG